MSLKSREAESKKSEAKAPSKLLRLLKEAIWLVLIFIFVSTALDAWRSQDMPKGEVPPLVMQTTKGETVDLIAKSHEKPVLVYFWGTWCSVCRFVSPTVDWLNNDYEVLSIAVNSGDDRRLNAYLNHHGYDFDTINDNAGDTMKQWGVSAVPSAFVIKDGHISSVTTGFSTPPGLWLRLKLAD
ncbi:protein disulfide oxidoreductase [Photobacterium minamisatsumaniensis]|uniref:protein disulfide oxidoreductase n=1 Tax=Photobacterium minamisatsumaniensis TaxID=2910233 RepID=UPI003D13274D